MKRIVVCTILAPIVLFVVQAVAASILLPSIPAPEGGLGFVALSTLITAWVLVTIAVTVTVRGWPRMAILFFVAAGIPANNLLEAVFFNVGIPRAHLFPLFLFTFAWAAVFAGLLDRLAGDAQAPRVSPVPSRTPGGWTLSFVLSDVAYIALYFAAGIAVWPFVREFYESRSLPETHVVAAMQVFRGLVFSAIVYTLMRSLVLTPVAASLLVGATLALLGGVAPLLVPNPYMPEWVRFPHMVETGVSSFLFGLIAARLLRPQD